MRMAVGSKDLSIENLAALDKDSLGEALRKAKEELFNLRFQSATGQLENNARLRTVRKDIARIYTVLRVPRGSPSAFRITAAFSSNLM